MKKMIISAFAVTLTLISCSSDDDKGNSNPLLGTWYEVEIVGELPLNDCEKQTNYNFTNNTITFKEYNLNSEDECELGSQDSASYSLSGDKIIVSGEETRFVISGNNLTLFHPQGNGNEVEAKYIKGQ